MTRLQTLIKEVLSQPKKKDCNCGCNDCGGKAPILTEGKVKHLISEGLQYHMDKKIQLHESIYRIGSEKHFELIREARALWVRGIIDVSEDDQAILETNLGHFGMYEGEVVPLDMPMVNEIKMPSQEEVDKFFSITQNEMHYLNSKPVMGQKGDRVRSEIEPWDEYDLSNWNALVRKAKAQGKINEGYLERAIEDEKDPKKLAILKAKKEFFDNTPKEKRRGMSDDEIRNQIKKLIKLDESKKKKKKDNRPIGKPMRSSSGGKAYKVYVRDPKTKKIKTVRFGSGGLRAKINDSKARAAFAKRHKCSQKKDRTKASYWSCRLPRYAKLLGLKSSFSGFW